MSKILFEMDNEKLANFDAIIARNGWSRAEAIRYAIDELIEQQGDADRLSRSAFGMWAGRKIDSVEYQKKLRAEWE